MSGARILVVDDEVEILRTVRTLLGGHGYAATTVETGEAAVEEVARRPPDVMLLDLMLPGIDGLEVIRQVRERSSLPFIVLSARGEELMKVQALDLGADDYVAKPFSANELLARLRVALRHSTGPLNSSVFEMDGLQVDFEQHLARVEGREIHLTVKENAVLKYLVAHAGRVITHRQILSAVWGPEYTDEVQYLRNIAVSLRRKLEPDPAHPRFILTEAGVGYRFRVPADA
jgi:two-component system KDP operon response regulator KdpE